MQLNVELPDAAAKRLKKDAVELGVTLNAYVLRAFEKFVSLPIASRRVYFGSKKDRKIVGRATSV